MEQAELVAKLRGGSPEEREAAYVHLLRRVEISTGLRDPAAGSGESTWAGAGGADLDDAVACVAPLCEICCRPVSQVDVEEWRRASQVHAALSSIDPLRVGFESFRTGQCNLFAVWQASDSALGFVVAKEPASLTTDDVITASWLYAAFSVQESTCVAQDEACRAAGGGLAWVEAIMPAMFMMTIASPSDERNLIMCPLLLDLLREPEHLPEYLLGGVLHALHHCVVGRPAVAVKLIEEGAIPVLVNMMCQVTPRQLIEAEGFGLRPNGYALVALKDLVESAQAGGIDLTAQLLSCGLIDLLVSALGAVEEVGEENVHGTVITWGMLMLLMVMDGRSLSAIEDQIRGIPSALRYVKESKITNCSDLGMSCSVFGTIVAANLWGKDEDNSFGFVQRDVAGFLQLDIEQTRCATWGSFMAYRRNQCRGLLSLCISDSAKPMLLNNTGFIAHLIDGLLLEPDHPRQGTDETIKAAVQRDFAECIQQIVLFPAGRDALKADSAVVAGLDALVSKAWTEEAKECARGALMQLADRHPKVTVIDLDERHIMLSYQWNAQAIIKRICAELQRRGYLVWVDFESMKGNLMDAMSGAIEGADIVLYGVSEAYKESANCRLELNYGQEQHLDLIPLLMQPGYKPKGWLGLIMGSKMYYVFYSDAVDTEEKFLQQMDALEREIGDRCRAVTVRSNGLTEGVPPAQVAAPLPAPAALKHSQPPTTHDPTSQGTASFTASLQESPRRISATEHQPTSAPGNFGELASFFREERAHFEASVQQQRQEMRQREQELRQREQEMRQREQEMRVEKAEIEAKAAKAVDTVKTELAAMTAQVEALREEARNAATRHPLADVLSQKQLLSLQMRAEKLHDTQLLSEEEHLVIEDVIADCIEALAAGPFVGDAVVAEVIKIVALSERIPSDMAFARQLRRKCKLST